MHIHVNGVISDPFSIFRETRQGCPLSPLLFAIEPLAAKLREAGSFSGLRYGQMEERVSYADDMLLYLQDSGPSLSAAFSIIQEFENYCFVLTGPNRRFSPMMMFRLSLGHVL